VALIEKKWLELGNLWECKMKVLELEGIANIIFKLRVRIPPIDFLD
jgi:hypothetical protein